MYSPVLGRFLQTDPIGYADGMNMYAYVGNDPVNGVDPTGLCEAAVMTPCEIVVSGGLPRGMGGGGGGAVSFIIPKGKVAVAEEVFEISEEDLAALVQELGEIAQDLCRTIVTTGGDPSPHDIVDAAAQMIRTLIETGIGGYVGNRLERGGSREGRSRQAERDYRSMERGGLGARIGGRGVTSSSVAAGLRGAMAGRLGGLLGGAVGMGLGVYFQDEIDAALNTLADEICGS